MEIATLGVVMSQRDLASKNHIRGNVLHRFGVEGGLEFG